MHCLEESGYPSASQPPRLLVLQSNNKETSTQPRVGPGSHWSSGPANLVRVITHRPTLSRQGLNSACRHPYLSRQEVGGVSFYDDPLQRDLFQSVPGLPGGGVRQDGREAHRHVGKVLQQGLNDRVAASEAMPGRRSPDQRALRIHTAAAPPPRPLYILPLLNHFLWIHFQE